jgi:hypothetical protein
MKLRPTYDHLRSRATDNFRLLLSLILAVGIVAGMPSAASAQQGAQPWTTVGSAGTVDQLSVMFISYDGPAAVLTGLQRGGAIIRYNVVAEDDLVSQDTRQSIHMLVRYRATPDAIVVGADSQVVAKLIEVNLFTGTSTTKLTMDSNSFPPSNDFQTQIVSTCPAPAAFDFGSNAYYIEVRLGKKFFFSGSPAIQAIRLERTFCGGPL